MLSISNKHSQSRDVLEIMVFIVALFSIAALIISNIIAFPLEAAILIAFFCGLFIFSIHHHYQDEIKKGLPKREHKPNATKSIFELFLDFEFWWFSKFQIKK